MMSQDRRRIWEGSGKQMQLFILAYLLLLALPCMGFLPNFWSRVLTLSWDSHTHQYITEQAILNVTLETLRSTKTPQGNNEEEQTRLGRGFWRAVGEVVKSNAAMDFLSSTRSDPVYHFDSEQVDSAMGMLRQFWAQTLLSVRAKEYQSARHSLGQLFHSLQDFYSHSNWVEMGQRSIYLHLLQPEEPAVPVAEEDTPTCMECFSATCRDNLQPRLTNTQRETQLLTTGYFSTFPPKPYGKCSHGGILDSSRYMGAKGGINKDSTSPVFSPHHYLHMEAANLAMEATLSVLRDLGDTVGPETFLRLFSVKQIPALVFVMDTTGSMFEEITAARFRAHSLIESRASNPGLPGTYVLVPFHDPEVGPVFETDDPNQFIQQMENLMALGGGDEPEMCLSAIQLALTHKQGGLTIFTTNSDIRRVSAIVEDNTATDKVTLLHVESDQDLMSSHSFRVDSSVKNVTLHITGILTQCILTSPSDQSQSLLSGDGPLAALDHFEARPVEAPSQERRTLTFNVIGESIVDFLYYFATVTNETHPGLERVEGSPVAGVPAFLVLVVTGLAPDEEASFSHVTLLGADGESLQQELVGWVDSVPRAPFCVRLTGRDSRGNKLERVSTERVQPTHVQIQVLSVPRLVPGHSTMVDFDILNHGPARLFSLTADDDCKYLHKRGPHSFMLQNKGPSAAGATVTLTLTVRALDSTDSNYAVAYLTVIPPDPDTSPPSCSAARVQSTCPSTCTESSWSVSLVVSDRGRSGLAALQLQKGEGVLTLFHSPPPKEESLEETQQPAHKDTTTIEGHHHHHHHKARLQRGDPPLNVTDWVPGLSQPLWARYSSSCCSPKAELLVWDTAGNMKRCRLTSGQQTQLRDRRTESSGARRITLTSVSVLVGGLLGSTLL
ncbi:von Willebrand factor A domain containing protein 7 [Dissostichus eleginoides]|uniref:von Willebrand factor A domain containing protein 7 n=1 Tax=Dissostichus eleginoides TaxID=100907 RepID=A0AAD9CI17_DISEL|nr:von Willebrand factor A domain containing protein 7 [Dissostichus eleginoides]